MFHITKAYINVKKKGFSQKSVTKYAAIDQSSPVNLCWIKFLTLLKKTLLLFWNANNIFDSEIGYFHKTLYFSNYCSVIS